MPEIKMTITGAAGAHAAGKVPYCVTTQEATLHRLNDTDGSFAAQDTPSINPYVLMTEDSISKDIFVLNESRSVWPDGYYWKAVYLPAGSSPVMEDDTLISFERVKITSDKEDNADFNPLQKTSLTAAVAGISQGAGAIAYPVTIKAGGVILEGAGVRVTTDIGGNNTVASGLTNSSGVAIFNLDAGSYYLWVSKESITFANPTAITVS